MLYPEDAAAALNSSGELARSPSGPLAGIRAGGNLLLGPILGVHLALKAVPCPSP